MQESPFRKIALPIVLASFIMVGVSSLLWYRDNQKIQTLTLATASETGEYYAFGQALAKVVGEHNPKIHLQVIPSEGSRQNVEWLQQKKVELAIVQSDVHLSPSLKTVSFLFPEVFHLIVRQSANINHFKDLRGKKIALMPKGSGSYPLFWVLSRHYGLKSSDFQATSMPLAQGIQQLQQGQVDAIFQVIALGNKQINQLLQNSQLKLVAVDQGTALQLFLPALEETQIPKGTYSGAIPIPNENLTTVGVRALLITHEQVSSEIIYEITRILYEARNDLIQENVQAAMIPPPDSLSYLGFSRHEGAKTYYNQDKPSFIVEYAEPISLGISVVVLGISGLWQLRMWLNGKQKNRADLYNLELIRLIREIHQVESLDELEQIRQKLIDIFEKVIIDLDRDLISPESFQSFTFPWEIAMTTLRHQELLIAKHQ